MRLSPLDIKRQDFTRSFRGFDEEEVTGFLESLSRQWDEVLEDQRRSQERVREMEARLEHYEKVEEALQEALSVARANAQEAREHAERSATLTIKEAEARAADIVREAENALRQMTSEMHRLESKQDEIVSRLRAFLQSELEMLVHFDGKGAGTTARQFPAEDTEKPHPKSGADEDPQPADASADDETVGEQPEPKGDAEASETQQSAEVPEEAEVEEDAPEAAAAEGPRHAWKVTPIVPGQPSDRRERGREEGGEMEKIRRILDDLD